MLTDSEIFNGQISPTCNYVLTYPAQVKKKSKYQIVFFTLLSPIYIFGFFIYGVFTFVQFLTQGGFFALLIVGWIISFTYNFFFTFLPFLLNLIV